METLARYICKSANFLVVTPFLPARLARHPMSSKQKFGSFLARLAQAKARLGSSRRFGSQKKLVSARLVSSRLSFGSSRLEPAKFLARSTSSVNLFTQV